MRRGRWVKLNNESFYQLVTLGWLLKKYYKDSGRVLSNLTELVAPSGEDSEKIRLARVLYKIEEYPSCLKVLDQLPPDANSPVYSTSKL